MRKPIEGKILTHKLGMKVLVLSYWENDQTIQGKYLDKHNVFHEEEFFLFEFETK